MKNKIYNGEYEADEHGWYALPSMANSDKNNFPNSHLLVTVSTNKDGDIDQTNAAGESSKYPIGFADNVLFSGRAFPIRDYQSGYIVGRSGKYPTSDANYLNVALTSLCFQMFAEVADVDQLLSMIRSTCLTDHIHFDLNGDGDTNDIHEGQPETHPLQLINPGGFFKKYCMAVDLPSAIGPNETIDLTKGWYKGLIFNIPGTEVKVDGEWIAFDAKNKDLILAQNPMNLTWRINGNLLKKMGYTTGQTIEGQIITIDDQWNGLRLEVPMTITIN